ncbi:hypothetical protein BG015_008533 [Linnemannia schmuckeri]|uniref:Galactose oxidase n=1 Tax=Linnemannia schmuckeri TaxID=64567 RepID=A0A9P5S0B2_9FUNG|nr:hypothetical protein BG015_008533 [Linnemannia schmuckeri]
MFHSRRPQGNSRRKSTLTPIRRSFFCLALSLSILATHFTTPTLAQSPSPVQEMAFMRGGNYLYVQGGKFVINERQISVSNQLAALDLSKPWSTNAPVWKLLSPGPAYNLYNGVSTADNQTLITFYNNQELFVNIYNVQSNSWQYTSVKPSGELLQAIRTVIDPKTGLVYIDGADNMNIFDPANRGLSYSAIPPGVLSARFFAGAGYHPTRRSIMYMGGVTGALQFEPTTYITEFLLDSQSWGTFPTTGDLPTPRCDHCMAISEDGNTVVMFGGRTPPPTNFTGTFYILDVPSKTWVQGPSASTRLYSACAIVGDQFVVWGGFDGKSTIDGPPIIYSFSQKKWVEQYTPPAYFASMPAPSVPGGGGAPQNPNTPTSPDGSSGGNTGNPSSSSSSNLGVILGGTLGSLCVMALAGVVYLYMKLRGDKAMYETQTQQRIIQQAERTNEPSRDNNAGGGGGAGSVARSAKYMKSGALSSLLPDIMTARNPQIAAAMAAVNNSNTSARSPQDAVAMGLHFEPHNRHDPQLLPMSPLNTPMGPEFQQQFNPPVFVPTPGSLTPTIFNPSTINCTQGGGPVVGYTTIPVQTTTGLAYMSVPVQSTPPCPGTIGVGTAGYGYASVPLQVPEQNFINGGLTYTSVPLQSPTGGYLQPAGVSGGTPTMGYAGFSPVQSSDHDSSPGSVHRPLVVSSSSGNGVAEYSSLGTPANSSGGGDYYYPPPPHPAASGP